MSGRATDQRGRRQRRWPEGAHECAHMSPSRPTRSSQPTNLHAHAATTTTNSELYAAASCPHRCDDRVAHCCVCVGVCACAQVQYGMRRIRRSAPAERLPNKCVCVCPRFLLVRACNDDDDDVDGRTDAADVDDDAERPINCAGTYALRAQSLVLAGVHTLLGQTHTYYLGRCAVRTRTADAQRRNIPRCTGTDTGTAVQREIYTLRPMFRCAALCTAKPQPAQVRTYLYISECVVCVLARISYSSSNICSCNLCECVCS